MARGVEISQDLLNILKQTDARRSLSTLRRAIQNSRQNLTAVRSTRMFSIEDLTKTLEGVAISSLEVERAISNLREANSSDIRIRLLTDFASALDAEKRGISGRLNMMLAKYSASEDAMSTATNRIITRKRLQPAATSVNPSRAGGVQGGSDINLADDPASKILYRRPASPSPYIPPTRKTRGRLVNDEVNTGPGTDRAFEGFRKQYLNRSFALDRNNSRRDGEFQERQQQFWEESSRKTIERLDTIADLLRKGNRQGGGSGGGGFGLPDLPGIDLPGGNGKGKGGRGSSNRSGGRFAGAGSRILGGLLKAGSLIGLAELAKEYNILQQPDFSKDGWFKGALNAADPNLGKLADIQSEPAAPKRPGASGPNENMFKGLPAPIINPTRVIPNPPVAVREDQAIRQAQQNLQAAAPALSRAAPQLGGSYDAMGNFQPGVISEDVNVDAKPNTTVNIVTDKLDLNGAKFGGGAVAGAPGSAGDTTFGGMGMSPGGIGGGYGGGGAGSANARPGGVLGGNTPQLIPGVTPGLGQTPSQAQADALQRLEQSKMPQYNPQMTPNTAAGGGPMQMPGGLGGPVPSGVTGLPFITGDASGSSALKNANGTTISTANTDMPAYQRALLDTVSRYESNGKGQGYNTLVGGGSFQGDQHPGNFGGVSTAAGRYQFLKGTWDSTVNAYNKANPNNPITDFSPANQDRAAYFLAQKDYARRTGRDLDADLKAGKTDLIQQGLGGQGLNTTWQGFQGKSDIQQTYENALKRNQDYAANSLTSKVDPNAVAGSGVGMGPRANLESIIGGATQGAAGSGMFATINPTAVTAPGTVPGQVGQTPYTSSVFNSPEEAKAYLKTVSAIGSSSGIMKNAGFDSIGNMNNEMALKMATAMKNYNDNAAANGVVAATLNSGARFPLPGIPGGMANRNNSMHAGGVAADVGFKGMMENYGANIEKFAEYAKKEGLNWGRDIYGGQEGHHFNLLPGKVNPFANEYNADGTPKDPEKLKNFTYQGYTVGKDGAIVPSSNANQMPEGPSIPGAARTPQVSSTVQPNLANVSNTIGPGGIMKNGQLMPYNTETAGGYPGSPMSVPWGGFKGNNMNPNYAISGFQVTNPVFGSQNTAPALPKTLAGMKQYAIQNGFDAVDGKKQPSPAEVADQNNAAMMLVETLKNKGAGLNPFGQPMGPNTQIQDILKKTTDSIMLNKDVNAEIEKPKDVNAQYNPDYAKATREAEWAERDRKFNESFAETDRRIAEAKARVESARADSARFSSDFNAQFGSSNAQTLGTTEGAARQSAAPPAPPPPPTPPPAPAASSDSSDSNKSSDKTSSNSATPASGGSADEQASLNMIPNKTDDMGLALINVKDLT